MSSDPRQRVLTEQLVIRMTPAMLAALKADAAANGRTVAQSIRYHLRAALMR